MNITSFLATLKTHNISLSLQGADLRVAGLGPGSPASLLQQIKENKKQIVEYLQRFTRQEPAPIPAAPQMNDYPLSFGQRQLWLADQASAAGNTYNLYYRHNRKGPLNKAVFEKAAQYLLQRHEVLRTVFADGENGEPRQKIQPVAESGFAVRWQELTGNDTETALAEIEKEEAAYGFNLQKSCLFRIKVVLLPANEQALLFTLHHIISDAWSIHVLLNELEVCYNAIEQGSEPALPPPALQYKDFACWQRSAEMQQELAAHKQYWLNALKDAPAYTDLPITQQRPAVKTYKGMNLGIFIGNPAYAHIKNLCREKQWRVFSFLAAVWKTLLYRYTGEPDCVLGFPVAGRVAPQLQQQLGYYVNVVLLRTRLNANACFCTHATNVENNMQEAVAHQQYPFDQLTEDLGVQYDPAYSPLFNVMIGYDRRDVNYRPEENPEAVRPAKSKFDVEADFTEYSNGIAFRLTVNADLFSATAAQRILQHYHCLLQQVLREPNAPVSTLNYIPAEEKNQLQEIFNQPVQQPPVEKNIITLFEELAERQPSHTALVAGGKTLTYREANETINRFAHYLRTERGIVPGDFIAVMMNRSEKMILALLGIIKAGAAYVPVDVAFPEQRRNFLLRDSGAKLVVTDDAVLDNSLPCAGIIWNENEFAAYSTANPEAVNTGTDPVYMIYTSGSTGTPKGVPIQHRSVANLCAWTKSEVYSVAQPPAKALLIGTISFDASVELIFPALLNGAALHIIPQTLRDDPHELLQYLATQGIEITDCIPSHLHLLLQVAAETGPVPAALRFVATGGELLQPETIALFFSTLPGPVVLLNGYGPTETCVNATCCIITRNNRPALHSIGRPLPNTQVYILDEQQQQTGIGIWGELYIGGTGLSTGYWNREALTKEKFIQHPALGRLYRSGDLVRWLDNGEMQFRGRNDHQVKLRGFRIETGEIEAALQSFSGVAEAVVVMEKINGNDELVAAIVWKNKESTAALREYLAAHLPQYMIPAHLVAVPEIPRMGTGKLNRQLLPLGELLTGNTEEKYRAPQTETEKKLALIWGEVLNRENIGINDSFIALGGHSLKAMRMVSLVHKQMRIKLHIKDVFQHDTISALAAFINGEEAKPETATIPPAPLAETYPLSPGQKSIWLACQIPGAETAYNMISRYSWPQTPHENRLRKAWQYLLERHETLHTVFIMHKGEPVAKPVPVSEILEKSFCWLNPADPTETAITELAQREQETRFSLTAGPLLRLTVLPHSEHCLLLLCIHHIISDAWSLEVMQRELLAIYALLENDSDAIMPPPAIQYRDYAVWQNSAQTETAQRYWKKRLKGDLPVLDLPADNARPRQRSFAGQMHICPVPAATFTALQKLAAENRCSMYALLFSLVQVWLHKYTGQTDTITGVPVAGRDRNELQQAVGYYINTLAVRSRFSSTQSFENLLQQTGSALLHDFQHQSYPFEKLMEDLHIRPDQSRHPLFDVLVNYELREGEMDEAGNTAEINTAARFDLSWHFTQYANGIAVALTANTALYRPARIKRMMLHFREIMHNAGANPKRALKDMGYLPAQEEHQVLQEFAQGPEHAYTPEPVTVLFEKQVERSAGTTALCFGNIRYTYRQLNEAVNRLANHIIAVHSVRPGHRIGIQLERSEKNIIAMLAVQKTGAAFVPVEPATPANRCRHIADECDLQLVIAEKEYVAWFSGPVLLWNETTWMHEPAENPGISFAASETAYIIYTSGSTGRPKGVPITHASLHNLCNWLQNLLYAGNALQVLVTAPFSFDASVKQIFPPLVSGSAIHIISEEERLNPVHYLQLLQQRHIEVFDCTPSFLSILLKTMEEQPAQTYAIRHVLAGGEALPAETVQLFQKQLPGVALLNVYGPTEACVDAAFKMMDAAGTGYATCIGKPLPNVQLYVADEQLQPVGIGICGELLIGGAGLSPGYINNPKLTAGKFIQHPQLGRVYRTGDRARWSETGEIEFFGRNDNQVKIRGYRIELEEIEKHLLSFTGVKHAVVLYDRSVRDDLIAFVVWQENADEKKLHQFLESLLPAYMVPAAIMNCKAIPTTTNGKADRRRLIEEYKATTANEQPYQAPENELQQQLAHIWCELLGQKKISIDDNFFRLGGHSLTAMRMVALLYTRLGISANIHAILESGSIRNLAARLENKTGAEESGIGIAEPATDGYPLSHAQKRLWVLDQLEKDLAAYNIVHSYHIPGNCNETFFRQTISFLMERHEILRTIFVEQNGEVFQQVLPVSSVQPPFAFFYAAGEAEKNKLLAERLNTENTRIFRLSSGPLFTLAIIQEPGRATCVLNMHHIISDAWSLNIFKREVEQVYAAFSAGTEPRLPALGIQYKDYAVWQKKQLQPGAETAARTFWRNRLHGEIPILDLPADFQRPLQKTYLGAQYSKRMRNTLFEGMQSWQKEKGCSVFTILLTMVQVYLYRITGQSDIITGIPVAGRDRPELQDGLGFYVNMLPFRLQINGTQEFDKLLETVKTALQEHLDHQSYPFDLMVEEQGGKRDLSRSPLFDVMVNHQYYNEPVQGVGYSLQTDGETGFSKYDLTFDFIQFADALVLNITFNTALFLHERVENMLAQFEQLWQHMLEEPAAPVSQLNYITGNEQQQLLRFNKTDNDEAPDLFPALLEKNARLLPEKTAFIFEGTRWNYEEFNTAVNRVAHYLHEQKVLPGDRVGVQMARTEKLIFAICGIIKAGGAYVPIDPAYPLQRQLFMQKDSALKLLLTDADTPAGAECSCVNWNAINFHTYSGENPAPVADAGSTAYIIYTSGSTGNPKGVCIAHSALANLVQWYTDMIANLNPAPANILVNASFNFDVSVAQLFGTLAAGETLILAPAGVKTDANTFIGFLDENQVELFDCTPSFLSVLTICMEETKIPSALKYVLAAGEQLSESVASAFYKLPGNSARLFNLYGPTEACVYTTAHEVPMPVPANYKSIGKPLPNVRIHMLLENGTEAGIGIWGELCIAGNGLAQGYQNRPELNREKFIHHEKFGRLYRSGDVARWNFEGEVEFLGRKDSQVKLRGFRIELGEIESAMRASGLVAEAVALVRENDLLAFVRWKNAPQEKQLKAYLQQQLPQFMLPAQWITVNEIPKSGSGKTDRKALLQQLPLNSPGVFDEPETPTEKQLAQIWREILKRERFSAETHFLELGGHSLNAMLVVAKVYKTFGVKIGIRDIFRFPHLRALAGYIDTQMPETLTEIVPVKPAGAYPASPGQLGIFLASRMQGAAAAFNIHLAYSWNGVLDKAAFRRAWRLLRQRHESLRTALQFRENKLVQRVRNIAEIPDRLFFHDISILCGKAQEAFITALKNRMHNYVFDIENGEVIRAIVVQRSAAAHDIFLSVHHIVADAWSLNVLRNDLDVLYRSGLTKEEPVLPALPVQYKDFVAWQMNHAQNGARRFWKEQLQGTLPVLDMPMDGSREKQRSFAGKTFNFPVPGNIFHQLLAFSRKKQTGLFACMASAVTALLFRYTAQTDLILGVPVTGREREELQHQVGYYVNLLPLRNTFSAETDMTALARLVQQNLLNIVQHPHYPFEQIVEDCSIKKEMNRHPLFDVVVNHDTTDAALESGESLEEGFAKFELSFHFTAHRNGMNIAITYAAGLYSDNRIRRMSRHLINLFAALASGEETPLWKLPLMDAAEVQWVSETVNATGIPFDRNKTITQLFEEQAAASPNAIAWYNNESRITYAELNASANRLARYLNREKRISAGDKVGVVTGRNEKYITVLLAILKCGAAYIPIDPAYPAERCRYMESDSKMKLVIAEAQYAAWCNGDVLCWEEQLWGGEEALNPDVAYTAEDAVYVIYTSGSTGKPKGVEVRHRSLHNLCVWHRQAFGLSAGSRVSLYAGIGFDASAWELWPCLTGGAAVYCFTEAERFDLAQLAEACFRQQITHSFLPTPVCEQLVQNEIPLPENICLFTGGDRLRVRPNRHLRLINNYGPTETTVVATSGEMTPEPGGAISIGKPIGNTKLYIVNEWLQCQPAGVYGEILIGGEGLAKGYLGLPELTAEKFIVYPPTGETVFRTGDFGRWLEDGSVEFLGRKDNQVKIRGYRIELGEIEAAALQVSGVETVRALISRENDQPRILLCYTGKPDEATFTGALQRLLPAYMVPHYCGRYEQLPLTENGKINDAVLLEMARVAATGNTQHGVFTETEMKMKNCWQQLLGMEPGSPDADFFESGGNSLLAMQLIQLVEKEWNKKISLRDIFNNPTIRLMTAALSGSGNSRLSVQLNRSTHTSRRLYLIPPIAGSSTIYASLAGKLSDTFCCTGLQYPGFGAESGFATSIETMARSFSEEIIPGEANRVCLLGYSYGALVAYETARLLEQSGCDVQLVLLDRGPITGERKTQMQNRLQNPAAIVEKELGRWFPAAAQNDRANMGKLILQNLQNLSRYEQTGSVKADILALESAEGVHTMQSWQNFTGGKCAVHTLYNDHYQLLNETGLPALINEFVHGSSLPVPEKNNTV